LARDNKKEFDFSTLGIIISVLVVVLSIICITVVTLHNDDDNPDEVTWVG